MLDIFLRPTPLIKKDDTLTKLPQNLYWIIGSSPVKSPGRSMRLISLLEASWLCPLQERPSQDEMGLPASSSIPNNLQWTMSETSLPACRCIFLAYHHSILANCLLTVCSLQALLLVVQSGVDQSLYRLQ